MKDLTRDRVANTSRYAARDGDANAQAIAGSGGSVAFALLEVAEAIRHHGERKHQWLLSIADDLAERVLKGEDADFLAKDYQHARSDIDQIF